METKKNQKIGEQGVNDVEVSKSRESLYVVDSTENCNEIQLEAMSEDNLHIDSVLTKDDVQVATPLSENSKGGESEIICEDKNNDINDNSQKENVIVLYDEANMIDVKDVKSQGDERGGKIKNANVAIGEYDTRNWEDWNVDQVVKYIEYLLIENNYDSKDIDDFMNKVLLKMKITGKVLKKLKNNDILWNEFRKEIKDHSFGIWIAIAESLEKL